MTRVAAFEVPYTPEPRREPLVGRRGHYQHPRNDDWYDRVAYCWRAAHHKSFGDAALELTITAVFPRPKTHWTKAGLSTAGVRSPYKTSRPDLSNLIKAVEDALNGLAYDDDSQIVAYGRSHKVWTQSPDEPGRLFVVLRSIGDPQ